MINSEREKIYFGSWCQKFHSIIRQTHCFRSVMVNLLELLITQTSRYAKGAIIHHHCFGLMVAVLGEKHGEYATEPNCSSHDQEARDRGRVQVSQSHSKVHPQ